MTRDPWLVFKWVLVVVIAILLFVALFADRLFGDVQSEHPIIQQHGTASWYSVASAKAEGCSGVTASGEPLDDDAYTCAIWKLNGKPVPFGTVLKVTHGDRAVWVRCNDRGPSKRLVKRGRIIDPSRRAFETLAPLARGVIPVKVEVAQ